MNSAGRPSRGSDRLRVVHLYPDLLSVYGDAGNVRTIVVRAERRGIEVELSVVRAGDSAVPPADVLLIGGGQDREQLTVARELERLGPAIRERIAEGAALLAVCGGYQNLGWSYRTAAGTTIAGPGILDIRTEAGRSRLVGSVVASLTDLPNGTPPRPTLIGFENHGGRTYLGDEAKPLGKVVKGFGNNGRDGLEGVRRDNLIGTYLHGPLLPKNAWFADWLIRAALGFENPLSELDDRLEHAAHADARRAAGV